MVTCIVRRSRSIRGLQDIIPPDHQGAGPSPTASEQRFPKALGVGAEFETAA
jgi:hypothetical protein